MGIHFDTSEVDRLAVDLTKAPGKVRRKVSQAIRKSAQGIQRDARRLCPVRTGALRDSISTDIGALEAEIGPTIFYGKYQEFGTSKMSPNPFMRPAFDRRAPLLERSLGDAVEDLL